MKLPHTLLSLDSQVDRRRNHPVAQIVQYYPECAERVALSAARRRLTAAAERRQRHRELTNEEYYQPGAELEELIECASTHRVFDAIVTRNYYGSLVLNARRALFIDVDVETSNAADSSWSDTFDDLCTVLRSERSEGFRIYRTAAGFRVLATAQEFVPGSERSKQLMGSVGADSNFVDLCGRQNNFRARLTPKPWRCGLPRPQFVYPRITPDRERSFATWLANYEHRSRDWATCQFLTHIGCTQVHHGVAPIIEVHDRETKARTDLPLA
jgi:hypothetical protein